MAQVKADLDPLDRFMEELEGEQVEGGAADAQIMDSTSEEVICAEDPSDGPASRSASLHARRGRGTEVAGTDSKEVRVLRLITGKKRGCGGHFSQIGLPPSVHDVLLDRGVKRPSPIQRKVIPRILAGESVLAIAPTGSGKTLAYVLPLLRLLSDIRDVGSREGVRALAILPTAELAEQVCSVFDGLCPGLRLRALCVHAGVEMSKIHRLLKAGCVDVLVATPGKLQEILSLIPDLLRPTLFFLFDEFDRLLDRGFLPQVLFLFSPLFRGSTFLFFSATAPHSFVKSVCSLVPKTSVVKVRAAGGDRVKYRTIVLDTDIDSWEEEREARLGRILRKHKKVLIFTKQREEADALYLSLAGRTRVAIVHSAIEEAERKRELRAFRGQPRGVLVGTSILSRGLDIEGLDCVVNYSCPQSYEELVHRCGRVGRQGRRGYVYTFFGKRDRECSLDLMLFLRERGKRVPRRLEALAQELLGDLEQGRARLPNAYSGRGIRRLNANPGARPGQDAAAPKSDYDRGVLLARDAGTEISREIELAARQGRSAKK